MLLWLELSSIAPSGEIPATAQYGLCEYHMHHGNATTFSCNNAAKY